MALIGSDRFIRRRFRCVKVIDISGDASDGFRQVASIDANMVEAWHVAWHPEGGHIAGCSHQARVHTWDSDSGELLDSFSTVEKGKGLDKRMVMCLQYSPTNPLHLATGSSNGSVSIFDLSRLHAPSGPSVSTPVHAFPGHANTARALQWMTPEVLVSAGDDRVVAVHDCRAKNAAVAALAGHAAGVLAVDVQGERVVSGSSDATVKVWDWRQRQCVYTSAGLDEQVWGVRYFQIGEDWVVAAAVENGTLALFGELS